MKTCKTCGKGKDESDFGSNRNAKDGLNYHCLLCCREKYKAYYKKTGSNHTPEKARRKREAYNTPLGKYRDRVNSIKTKYSITEVQLTTLMDNQRGLCPVCGDSLVYPDSPKSYCVDHNHNTGSVRGLLCSHCNTAYGKLKEDLSIMKGLIAYHLEHLD